VSVETYVGGRLVSVDVIHEWELRRIVRVARSLRRAFGLPKADIARDERGRARDVAEMRDALVDLKLGIGVDALRSKMRRQVDLTAGSTKVMNMAGRGRRRSSVIEMFVHGCVAADMRDRYFGLMLHNSRRNRHMTLAANPDHHVLEAHEGSVQEVVETTGGSPMASRFFVRYGVEDGLTSRPDPLFPEQIVGVCCLADGTEIGGVRHQLRDHQDGMHARLEVEFPALLLPHMIQQHQMHLACEFHRWFSDLLIPINYEPEALPPGP